MIPLVFLWIMLQALVYQASAQIDIRHTLTNTTLREGDSLQLGCVMGDPAFDPIEWYKGRIQLSNNAVKLSPELFPDYSIEHAATETDGIQQYVLTVPSVAKENDGMYKCKGTHAINGATATSKLRITVLYDPDTRYPECSMRNITELVCNSEIGNPRRDLAWTLTTSANTHRSNESLPSTNDKLDNYHHDEIVQLSDVPAPLLSSDELTCGFVSTSSRNCSIRYQDIYDRYDRPSISPSMFINASTDATVSCTSLDGLPDSRMELDFNVYPSETIVVDFDAEPLVRRGDGEPTEDDQNTLRVRKDDGCISFLMVPQSVEQIHVWCSLVWGGIRDLRSKVSYIEVRRDDSNVDLTTAAIIGPTSQPTFGDTSSPPPTTAQLTTEIESTSTGITMPDAIFHYTTETQTTAAPTRGGNDKTPHSTTVLTEAATTATTTLVATTDAAHMSSQLLTVPVVETTEPELSDVETKVGTILTDTTHTAVMDSTTPTAALTHVHHAGHSMEVQTTPSVDDERTSAVSGALSSASVDQRTSSGESNTAKPVKSNVCRCEEVGASTPQLRTPPTGSGKNPPTKCSKDGKLVEGFETEEPPKGYPDDGGNWRQINILFIIMVCSLTLSFLLVTSALVFRVGRSESGSYKVTSANARHQEDFTLLERGTASPTQDEWKL